MKSNVEDLTGKTSGRLTVISRAPDRVSPNGKKRIYWNCECSCGNTCEVRSDAIRTEKSKSCGCLTKEVAKINVKRAQASGYKNTPENLIGRTFGRLLVVSEAERSVTPKGRELVRWNCECKCGTVKSFDGQSLRQGKYLTCGCVPPDFADSEFTSQTEVFVYKAKQVHGSKYNYDLVDYKDSRLNVSFVCSTHGVFLQKPSNHLSGYGCPRCSGTRGNPVPDDIIEKKIQCEKHLKYFKPSVGCKECIKESKKSKLQEFIEQSISIHQSKYDYSLVTSLDSRLDYVDIICPTHGKFSQQAVLHASGQGCRSCHYDSMKVGLEAFIERSNKVHSNRFDYSKVNYEHCNTPVLIICKDHGDFYQKPSAHLNGQKCPKCAGEDRAAKQHWNYIKRCELNQKLANSSGVLYLLEMSVNDEKFLKVGISSEYKKRLTRYTEFGIDFEILKIIETTALNSAILERSVLKFIKDNELRYIPKHEFKGWTECATLESKDKLLLLLRGFIN